jgi:hypothetical protein
MSTRRRYNLSERGLTVVFTAKDGRNWNEGGAEQEAFRGGVRQGCFQRASKASKEWVRVYSHEGELLAHWRVTKQGLADGREAAGRRRVLGAASFHVAQLEQQELLPSSGTAPAKEKALQRKGTGEEARPHEESTVITPKGWLLLQLGLKQFSNVLGVLKQKAELAGEAWLEGLVEAEGALREAVEEHARPVVKGTLSEEEGRAGAEAPAQEAHAAPGEPTAEELQRGQLRGELLEGLSALGFALAESSAECEVWRQGSAEVRVFEKGVRWRISPEEGVATLAFEDALRRAESEREAKEAAAEKERPSRRKGKKAPPSESPPQPEGKAPAKERAEPCAERHPEHPKLVCDRGAHGDGVHGAGKGAKRKEWITSSASNGEEAQPKEELAVAGKATPGPYTVEEKRAELKREHEEQPPMATPGPWGVVEGEDDGRSKRRSLRVVADEDVVVATLTYERDDSEGEAEARANAKLIAAANSMKGLLAELVDVARRTKAGSGSDLGILAEKAKEVLAVAGVAHG